MFFCGTDIIEVERIEKAIIENEKGTYEESRNIFLNKIYTINEIEYCESKGKMKYQHYAVRFAAKEAIFKAVSNILEDKYEISWKNAEIINDENGRPAVIFNDISERLRERIENIDISLSHTKENAIAMVIVQAK